MPSVNMLRGFLDSLEEGALFLDAERRILDINKAAQRMVGQNDAIGSLCPTVFSGTPCSRECRIRGSCSLTPAPGEDGKIQDIVLKGANGGDIALRMWAMLLPPNDDGVHCAMILRDRSRELELEKEVRERWQFGGLIGRGPREQRRHGRCARRQRSPTVDGRQWMRCPGCAPVSGDSKKISAPSPAASAIPSLVPTFMARGARLATTTMSRPTRASGAYAVRMPAKMVRSSEPRLTRSRKSLREPSTTSALRI